MSEHKASPLTLRLFRIASYLTGAFLLFITLLFVIRLASQRELWALGPHGLLSLESFTVDSQGFKTGLPQSGLDLTSISLILHGWLYVFYLYTNYRMFSELRWKFGRFILMAAGGIVPLWSFFSERYFHRLAVGEKN